MLALWSTFISILGYCTLGSALFFVALSLIQHFTGKPLVSQEEPPSAITYTKN